MGNTKKKILITVLISIVISIIYELFLKYVQKVNSIFLIDKIIVDAMIVFFIAIHFVIGISKIYNFLIENRYKIVGILLILLTLLQYSGSSNGIFSRITLEINKDNTLFGVPREIHSNEYALETLLAVAQKDNDYDYINNSIRGSKTDVFSVLHVPVKDILSIGRIFNLGYYILGSGMGLAFWWNIRFFALILVSFELCMLITNKNKKISCCGTIIIAFSGACQWWFSHHLIDILIWGQLIIVLLDKFLLSNKYTHKILYSLGITISIVSYIFTQYPAWMISFGYVFLALMSWVIIKNRKDYKFNVKDILIITINFAIVGILIYRYFILSNETLKIINNTIYPGKRFETGGNGLRYLFSYLYNFLLPYKNLGNNYEMANIISIFPIPMIMAIYYLYKKEKHISFLLPIAIVAVLETVFCISGFPEIISKLTMFRYVIVERAAVAVSFANMYILLYMLSNIQEDFFKIKSSIKIATITMCVVILVPLPEGIATRRYVTIISCLLCMYTFLFLNNGDSRYRKVLLSFLVIFTIVGSICVNPITKGTYIITETNLAKKIQEISNKDKDSLWMTLDNMMTLSNYAVANGAKTINSTHIYPNEEFYQLIFEKYKDIWNRYAHIEITLDKENKLELIDKDKIKLYITLEKINELGIDYIVTYQNEKEIKEKGIDVEVLYENKIEESININGKQESEIYIYKIIGE